MNENKIGGNKGLGFTGGLLFVLLSFLVTPFGALAIAYFVFKNKERGRWKTAKKLFWTLMGIYIGYLLIFSLYWILALISALTGLSVLDARDNVILANLFVILPFFPILMIWFIWFRK